MLAALSISKKIKNCPCILEGHRMHKTHSECIQLQSPKSNICVDWDLIPKVKLSIRYVINLEDKDLKIPH